MTAKSTAIDERLADIVQWGEKLARHIRGMEREQFMADEKTQDAVSKCAEAMGEAAKEVLKMDPEFDSRHPDLNLKLCSQVQGPPEPWVPEHRSRRPVEYGHCFRPPDCQG